MNNKTNKIEYHNKTNFKYFLGGFIEGEGSLTISIKKKPHTRFGYTLDPEFFLYQHISGIELLKNAQKMFGSGRIFLKSGSENVYVFAISNRKTIIDKVIPYFKKYVLPFSQKFSFFNTYVYIVNSLEQKKHLELKSFFELLKLTYELNLYSKGKERQLTYEEICNNILRDYTPNKTTE